MFIKNQIRTCKENHFRLRKVNNGCYSGSVLYTVSLLIFVDYEFSSYPLVVSKH